MKLRQTTGPESAKLSQLELQEMAAWVIEEARPKDGDPRSHTRKRLRDVMSKFGVGRSALRRFSTTHKKQKAWLSERRGEFEFKFKDLAEANERGDLILERKNGKVVSFVILKPLRTVGENSHVSGEVFELGRAFTVPEERGNGHYSRVRVAAIAHAKNQHPEASLITATDVEHVKNMNRRDDWQEISMSDFLRIYDDEPADWPGWCGFYKKL
jgi:predicted GNAT family N-acyltransferase